MAQTHVKGGTGDLQLQAAHLYIQNTFGQGMIDAVEGGGVIYIIIQMLRFRHRAM